MILLKALGPTLQVALRDFVVSDILDHLTVQILLGKFPRKKK